MNSSGEDIVTTLPTDKLNHDRDVTSTNATMSRHDRLLPEIPCRFGNYKAFYRLGLSEIIWPTILVHSQHIPVAMSCLPISAEY